MAGRDVKGSKAVQSLGTQIFGAMKDGRMPKNLNVDQATSLDPEQEEELMSYCRETISKYADLCGPLKHKVSYSSPMKLSTAAIAHTDTLTVALARQLMLLKVLDKNKDCIQATASSLGVVEQVLLLFESQNVYV